MPCILKLKIVEARGLPVMDSQSQLADPYVEIRFGALATPLRTETVRKTLNPEWNQDFRIEVPDDRMLQDDPLELKVWDYDIVSADDVIGSVYIDLSCLLLPDSPPQIGGWFPIYDTLRGVCGELLAVVKLQFFGDVNPYKELSVGVQVFSSSLPPTAYRIAALYGFVEELAVDDDPDYNWMDMLRTPRSSNESRQLLLYMLAGRVRRQLGRKVIEMGGNAVLSYKPHVDLEGGTGIVVRACGTAVLLMRLQEHSSVESSHHASPSASPHVTAVMPPHAAFSPTAHTHGKTPVGSPVGMPPVVSPHVIPQDTDQRPLARFRLMPRGEDGAKALHLQEIQLITMSSFPQDVLRSVGGVVVARSVQLMASRNMQQTRDKWWAELREEVRAHARALGCLYVIGYTETVTILPEQELALMTAFGTAAFLNLRMPGSEEGTESPVKAKRRRRRKALPPCTMCHVPYGGQTSPFPAQGRQTCLGCRRHRVPEVILSTVEMPPQFPIIGRGSLVQARVCRSKKKLQGEANATHVSESLPFLEYEIHKQLMYKLKILGMNAAFSLCLELSVGEDHIVALATATAVYCPALPQPSGIRIARNIDVVDAADEGILLVQQRIGEMSLHNREILKAAEAAQSGLSMNENPMSRSAGSITRNAATALVDHDHYVPLDDLTSERSEVAASTNALDRSTSDPLAKVDVNDGVSGVVTSTPRALDDSDSSSSDSTPSVHIDPEDNDEKKAFVVEVDDEMDEDSMAVLLDPAFPPGITVCSTDTLPGCIRGFGNYALYFTLLKRVSFTAGVSFLNQELSNVFHDMYQTLVYKTRMYRPVQISGIRFDVQLPDDSVLQVMMRGVASVHDCVVEQDFRPLPQASGSAQSIAFMRNTAVSPDVFVNNHAYAGSPEWKGNAPAPRRRERPAPIVTDNLHNDALSTSNTSLTGARSLFNDDTTGTRGANIAATPQTTTSILATAGSTPVSASAKLRPTGVPIDPSSAQTTTLGTSSNTVSGLSSMAPSAVASPYLIPAVTGGSSSVTSPGSFEPPGQMSMGNLMTATSTVAARRGSAEQTPESPDDMSFPMTPLQNPVPLSSASRVPLIGQVDVTSLPFVPGAQVERYLGRLSLHFIKESWGVKEFGGMGTFANAFLAEVHGIARAHAAALGGNAILSFDMVSFNIVENTYRNQGYCLISLHGDVVDVAWPRA